VSEVPYELIYTDVVRSPPPLPYAIPPPGVHYLSSTVRVELVLMHGVYQLKTVRRWDYSGTKHPNLKTKEKGAAKSGRR